MRRSGAGAPRRSFNSATRLLLSHLAGALLRAALFPSPIFFSLSATAVPVHPPTGASDTQHSGATSSTSIHVIDLKGVSGKRFSGDRIRTSNVPLNFQGVRQSDLRHEREHKNCAKWIVVTSIFPPSDAVRKLGEMTKKGWCFVVVADQNGPKDYDDVEGVVYLTVEQQKRLHYHIIDILPWRHFGRKNIGFLYAIEHGAQVIYDTDDDNRIKELDIPIWGSSSSAGASTVATSQTPTTESSSSTLGAKEYVPLMTYTPDPASRRGNSAEEYYTNVIETFQKTGGAAGRVVNTYLDFQPSCGLRIWPRGYPLDHINDVHDSILIPYNSSMSSTSSSSPGPQATRAAGSTATRNKPPAVQQFLADEDPDVDAIYRLTGKLPCRFEEKNKGIVVPKGKFTPYNAQCVVNLQPAFWALLLPVTVNGRVSDIWRSYIAQKLLWDIDEHVAFMPAHVVHDRVFHDYLKDFQSESDLYLKSAALVKFLSQWTSAAPTLVERIEQLWSELYERGFIEVTDLKLAQAWIRDLLALGYRFPDLQIPKILSREHLAAHHAEL
ncbi:unnamed protein product [Amoebophrya sp. A120]|nr:unnamed protein product [Amoebophrya sp. A120]|eukprot:GSA120T00020916001.1